MVNVFLYGRGTENRTLINRLKAYYFAVKLYPHMFGNLVTVHLDSPLKCVYCTRILNSGQLFNVVFLQHKYFLCPMCKLAL